MRVAEDDAPDLQGGKKTDEVHADSVLVVVRMIVVPPGELMNEVDGGSENHLGTLVLRLFERHLEGLPKPVRSFPNLASILSLFLLILALRLFLSLWPSLIARSRRRMSDPDEFHPVPLTEIAVKACIIRAEDQDTFGRVKQGVVSWSIKHDRPAPVT
jgi:hypothetical protein